MTAPSLTLLAVFAPLGAAAAVGLGVLVWWARRRRSADLIRMAAVEISAVPDLATLRSFSQSEFQVRLTEVYRRVSGAWNDRRLSDLERDVTLDLLSAWAASVPAAPAPLLVPIPKVTPTIVEAGTHAGYERLTVRLDGGDWNGAPAMQMWTFERGSPSANRGHTCPSCGAPLALDHRGRCASCGMTIDVGRLVWVLARVESPRDWSSRQLAPDQQTLEELDAIAAADAGFEAEVFTDRVMALYPELSRAIQDPSSTLARVAIAPRLLSGLQTMRAVRDRLGRRVVFDSIHVTGVMISSAAHRDDGDFVTVDIAGAAVRYEVDAAGMVVKGDRLPCSLVDRWTFARPPGLTTGAGGAVLMEMCAVCSAPIELDEAGRCAHCGAEVVLGSRHWVLTAMTAYAEPEVRVYGSPLPTMRERRPAPGCAYDRPEGPYDAIGGAFDDATDPFTDDCADIATDGSADGSADIATDGSADGSASQQ